MEDTSGFYKQDIGGSLLYGRLFVLNANYSLNRDQHTTYSYPVDGWSWFESEDEARTAFGMPSKRDEIINSLTEGQLNELLGQIS